MQYISIFLEKLMGYQNHLGHFCPWPKAPLGKNPQRAPYNISERNLNSDTYNTSSSINIQELSLITIETATVLNKP